MASMLEKLKEQQDKLNKKIKVAQAAETKKKANEQNMRARIIGQAITEEMKNNEQLRSLVDKALNTHITNPKERKIFDLEAITKKTEN